MPISIDQYNNFSAGQLEIYNKEFISEAQQIKDYITLLEKKANISESN